jgi:stress-induced morphogen
MQSYQSPSPTVARETHFRVFITSEAFRGKAQPARHRLVSLLRDEMNREGGIHALQLRTITPEEAEARRKKEEEEGAVTCKPKEGELGAGKRGVEGGEVQVE